MAVTLQYAGQTDIGRARKNNEDQFLIADLTKHLTVAQSSLRDNRLGGWVNGPMGHMLVVADGMGGVAGGEIASELAVETISWYVARTMPWFFRFQDGREKELEAELVAVVEACQQTVADAAAGSRFPRMGTTLTMAYVLWPRVYVVHAGDSRCYLHRSGRLARMTKDHTVAQRALDEGLLTKAQAESSALNNTLWNVIGGSTEGVRPDVYHATLQPGDLLLCTDGLTRHLDDPEISALLKQSSSPEVATRALIAAANEAGGKDNITVIVARVQSTSPSDATPLDGVAFLPPV